MRNSDAPVRVPGTHTAGFGDRLELALGSQSLNWLATKSHVAHSLLRKYVAGSEPGLEKLVRIADALGVTVEWLATGRGSMKGSEDRSVAVVDAEGGAIVGHRLSQELGSEFTLLPRYEVRAAAGGAGAIISENVVDYLAFKTEWIVQRLRRNPATLFLFEIMGDSMENTFHDGDLVLADGAISSIRDNAVYALGVDDTVIAKRLQRRATGNIVVKSDNPRYEPDELTPHEASQLRILGQVLWRAGML